MNRREAILGAATALFANQGYSRTAVSEIADRASVAQGTVFHHFKSKENLLVSICDGLVQTYIEGVEMAAKGPGSGWDALERVLKFNEEFNNDHRDAITVVFRETRSLSRTEEKVQQHFCGLVGKIVEIKSQCIQQGMEDGSIRPVNASLTALLIHFLLVGRLHIETEDLLDVPEINDELLEFCRRSLKQNGQPGGGSSERSGG